MGGVRTFSVSLCNTFFRPGRNIPAKNFPNFYSAGECFRRCFRERIVIVLIKYEQLRNPLALRKPVGARSPVPMSSEPYENDIRKRQFSLRPLLLFGIRITRNVCARAKHALASNNGTNINCAYPPPFGDFSIAFYRARQIDNNRSANKHGRDSGRKNDVGRKRIGRRRYVDR